MINSQYLSRFSQVNTVLGKAPRVKAIAKLGAGLDTIDIAAATRNGVIVFHTPGANNQAVADHTFALILGVARKLVYCDRSLREKRWEHTKVMGLEIWQKTLGLIGLGAIGRCVALRAQGFQMKVVAHDPFWPAEFAAQHGIARMEIDELLKIADIVSIHAPLTPENKGLIDQRLLRLMKPSDFTVEVVTDGPSPVLLRGLVDVKIMSRAWATKHNVLNPQDYVKKEETHAARNTNGTGQFMLKSFEPDVRTVLVANPNWWDKAEGNVTEIVYRPIKSDATRAAALLSNEIDLVLDPPTQDIPRLRQNAAIKTADSTETRIIFIGVDQWRDETPYASDKGKNPFKDKRVGQAMYQAIDIEAIRRATMRGLAVPTGSMLV